MNTSNTQQPDEYQRAELWAISRGADDAGAGRFAADYASFLDEVPANRFPDLPVPTPDEFADENEFEYGQLLNTAPRGTVMPFGDRWMTFCASCKWDPTPASATTYALAKRAAAVHNSEIHMPAPRPQWADVSEWAARNTQACS